jgi:putative ABC transport system ATP-binding protein
VHRFYFSGDYTEVAALKDVSLTFFAGEFVAIMGHSGSGKSTLLNIMAGLENPDGGSVWVRGNRISHRARAEQAVWRGASIGVLTQGSALLDHLSVEKNVQLAAYLRRRARVSRRAQRLGIIPPEANLVQAATPQTVLQGVGLWSRRAARPSTLSGGETARANLAAAMSGAVDVLLADEPTAEISRPEERDVLELISSLRPPGGVTVIVTHSDAVAATADRIVELSAGTLR